MAGTLPPAAAAGDLDAAALAEREERLKVRTAALQRVAAAEKEAADASLKRDAAAMRVAAEHKAAAAANNGDASPSCAPP
jgi:hypothetical protein